MKVKIINQSNNPLPEYETPSSAGMDLRARLDEPVAVMEVDCRSQGDDRCRFLVGSPTTLLLVHKKLAQSGSLDEALTSL